MKKRKSSNVGDVYTDVTLQQPLLIALMLENVVVRLCLVQGKKGRETSCNSRQRKKIWSSMTTSINDATVNNIASLDSHGDLKHTNKKKWTSSILVATKKQMTPFRAYQKQEHLWWEEEECSCIENEEGGGGDTWVWVWMEFVGDE